MTTTTDDVATTLGVSSPTDLQVSQWELWIGDATRAIDRWAERNGFTGLLNAADVDYVVREAVALKAKRPDGATQVEVAVDDGRVSRRYESSTGQITILPEWLEMLTPMTATTGGAFSIRPTSTPDTYAARAERACAADYERRW